MPDPNPNTRLTDIRNNFTPLNRITDFIKICFLILHFLYVVLIRLRIIIELSDRLSFFSLSVGIFACLFVSLIVIFFYRPGCRLFVCRSFLTCLLLCSYGQFVLVVLQKRICRATCTLLFPYMSNTSVLWTVCPCCP